MRKKTMLALVLLSSGILITNHRWETKMETKIVDVRLYKDYKEKDEEWTTLAAQAYETKKLAKHFSDEAASLLNKLKSLSDDTSCHGGEFVYDRTVCRGKVDYMAIPAIAVMPPEALDDYRGKESISWKLSKK